ncbi:MAG: phosphoribosylamine--glycine ligase [Deltaproteobacteria bacterium]|nr:phosphoribosylamine--glycine ligase [Deltaproteobacteria bacterium]
MKILVIGGGGREHAIAWKAAASDMVEKVFVAPGNAGTEREPGVENISIGAADIEALAGFAKDQSIDLTIVGPEAPLVAGITDLFESAGLRCFGPSRAAAQLEGSKVFTKEFLKRHNIPTAGYEVFTEPEQAKAYLAGQDYPLVVKADGLAAGKGVIIAETYGQASSALDGMLSGRDFGPAGKRVVVEEFLRGEEASFIVMTDGRNILPLATSQDHKAINNGDTGLNTGGMGAYSPAPVVTPGVHYRIMREVIIPTVEGMASEGIPYMGFLYAGLMVSPEGVPKVLEFNCRFGDPETQPILMRLKSDLVEMCIAALEKRLDRVQAQWDKRAALGVVMAAGGYPESYRKGDVISGLPQGEEEGLKVFHAGTAVRDGRVVTNGGRVLCATALGNTVSEAQEKAYALAGRISWDGVYYRTDIGYRAVQREKS